MRSASVVFAVAAYLVGVAGQALFFAFVVGVGTDWWPRDAAHAGAAPWLSNAGLIVAFAVQHSGMARQSFKHTWTRWIPTRLERSVYVGAAGIALAVCTLGWQPLPGELIWQGPLWIEAVAIVAMLATGACCLWCNHLAFFGVLAAWTGNPETGGSLCITGPYRYVRHPLMLGLLTVLWAQPRMPPELLLLNLGLTGYILVAIRLEEADLLRQFGAEYEQYRREVPALVPFGKTFGL